MRIGVHVVAQPSRGDGQPDVGWIDAILERVDAYPIERLSTGDVVGNHLECFTALGYMAARTRRVGVGPFITTAAVRDPGLLAAAAASLDAISRGRAYVVLGRGDGIVRNLGLAPQTVAQTRAAVVALRALLHEGSAQYEGRTIRLAWPDRPGPRIPVYVAPGGPRMLRMAAEVCDGVYLATGCTEANVASAREAIAATVRDEPLDVWWVTRFGVGDDFEQAAAIASEGLSSIGNHALRGDYGERDVPERLRPALREYHGRYRYDRKNPLDAADRAPTNVELMNELGLRDYFIERFGIVGTPEQVVDRLAALEARGVDAVTLLATSVEQLDLIGATILPGLDSRHRAASGGRSSSANAG